jgi:hypothetical protein
MGLFKNKRNNCDVKFHYQQDGYNFDITIDFGWNDNNKNYLSKEFVKKNVPVHIVFCEIPEVEPRKIYLEYGKDNQTLEFDFNKRIEHVIETWICDLKRVHPLTFGIISDEIAEQYNGRCFAKMDKSCSIRAIKFVKLEVGFWVQTSEFALENGNVTDLGCGGSIYEYNLDEEESKRCFEYITEVDPSNGFIEVDESIYNAVREIVNITFEKDYEINDSYKGRISNLLHFLFFRMPVSE